MGINQNKELGKNSKGNCNWILPHGMVLQVESFHQDESVCESDRKINYITLSNRIDMKQIILTENDESRIDIENIVKEKIGKKVER